MDEKDLEADLHNLLSELQEDGGSVDKVEDKPKVQTISTKSEQAKTDIEPEVVEDKQVIDLAEYKQKLDALTEEVLNSCRNDRREAQDVINLLRERIEDSPGHPPRMYVDGLVKAVEVKANISQNAIKMMETNIKFLSSTKPAIQMNQGIITGTDANLEDLLSQPILDDDV